MTTNKTLEALEVERFPLVKLGYDVRRDSTRQTPDGLWYWTMTRDGVADVVASGNYFMTEGSAWENAEADARNTYPEGWFEQFYLTTIQLEVVSETGNVPEMDLATIAQEMIVGDLSGMATVTGHWRLSAPEAAAELEAQGSSADFFSALAEIDELSRFMRPSPAKAFAQGVRALLYQHMEAANTGAPVRLDAKLLRQLVDEADAILHTPA